MRSQAHHEEVKAETILAPLVDAADAISGARPGARREVPGELCEATRGPRADQQLVQGRRAIRSRCRRVGKSGDRRSRLDLDDQTMFLARDIARGIEQEMTVPGDRSR
jgi:ribonuclease Y